MKFKKFISYYRPYKRIFGLTLICSLLVTVITLVIPLIIRYITENLIQHFSVAHVKEIYLLGAAMVLLILIQFLCHIFIDYYGHVMGAKMEKDMSEELYEHIQSQPHHFFDRNSTGGLMSRLTGDLENLSELYHHGPEDILMYIIRFIGAVIILLYINVELTIVMMLFIPIMIVVYWYYIKKLSSIYEQDKATNAEIHGFLENTISGIKVTKSFTNESFESNQYKSLNKKAIEIKKKVHKYEALYNEIIGSIIQAMPVIIIVLGALLIMKKEISIGDLLAFVLYVGNIATPIEVLVKLSVQYNEGISGFNRFFKLMQLKPDITSENTHQQQTQHSNGAIQFDHVYFQYDQEYIIHNLNLTIEPGAYIALVGPSGSGKSTIANLLPRFYDVTSGSITINHQDIRTMPLEELRQKIGIVQQDVYIFSSTVYENIKYGNPEASMDEIIHASKLANAHEFIQQLPNGYHTQIGEKGAKLSGGQKQRLSIARMFLKNPEVVILDEATSALDNLSEKVVQQSLEQLTLNRTTIVIAHRLSTIRNADNIYVLTKEGIIESGNHDTLIEKQGFYYRMYINEEN